MYAPSETARDKKSNRGSTIASSTTCVPRSRFLVAIWLAGSLIAHHRSRGEIDVEWQIEKAVRNLHVHFAVVSLNAVDRCCAALQNIHARLQPWGQGTPGGIGSGARGSRAAGQAAIGAGGIHIRGLQIVADP